MLQACHRFLLLFLFTGTLAVRILHAQGPMPARSAAELQAMLNRTQVLGSVLYVAAHPDDENTRLITYLARGKGYRTAYLSLTRGDGGQNLIGSEAGPALGVLRTQELLAARRVDGGEQMFSRAYDFGYSKNPEETFRIWGKDSILADVVWAIRKFKPDVIITRFPGPEKGGGGHGHHTASAMLAQEAFSLAADPAAFPEQLKYVSVWQAKRLLWNAWQPQGGAPALENLISVEIGGFDPLLGRSYGEIAAEARSMHRCQAFGVARVRGSVTEFLQHEKGEQAKTDLFEGINTTWERVEGGDAVQKWLLKAWQSFDPAHPELIVPYLSKALLTMEGKEGYWYEVKRREMQELLLYCAGIWMEVNSSAPAVAQGDSADMTAFIIKRSNAAVTLKSIYFGYPGETSPWNAPLKSTQAIETAKRKFVVRDLPVSQPYWLAETQETGRYVVSDRRQIGLPENPPALEAQFEFVVGGYQFSWKVPVVHKYVDRSVGELYRPFVVTPRATVNFDRSAYVFGNGNARDIQLTVRAWTPGVVTLAFDAPTGWKVTNSVGNLKFASAGEEKTVAVTLSPDAQSEAGEGKLKVWVETNGTRTSYGFQSVSYEHIPTQYIFKTAQVRVVRTDLAIAGKLIGYLQGSGDEIPAGLEQMGYRVELLNEADVTAAKLSKYDAVIAGIRAYNTQPRMPFLHEQLMEYVKQGGVYMVQYNTNFDLSVKEPGPYPMRLSRDRVTDENSPVKLLKPEHQVFNYPNKITDTDFSGWIQERGLYFPDQWSSEYEAVLEMNDPGEKATQGALLLARSGKGWYIHSGLAWFRQIPAGTPGAYRLLANMLSLAQTPAQP